MKARPGFIDFAQAPKPIGCIAIFPPPLECTLSVGKTLIAFDLGGVVEFYPSRWIIVRADLSDLLVRYPGPAITRRQTFNDNFAAHNLRFTAGVSFRF